MNLNHKGSKMPLPILDFLSRSIIISLWFRLEEPQTCWKRRNVHLWQVDRYEGGLRKVHLNFSRLIFFPIVLVLESGSESSREIVIDRKGSLPISTTGRSISDVRQNAPTSFRINDIDLSHKSREITKKKKWLPNSHDRFRGKSWRSGFIHLFLGILGIFLHMESFIDSIQFSFYFFFFFFFFFFLVKWFVGPTISTRQQKF